jgi:CHASE3 domain sensor protein
MLRRRRALANQDVAGTRIRPLTFLWFVVDFVAFQDTDPVNSYSEQCATKKSPVGGASAAGELQEALSTLKDAETGQRGYLLTGKDQYLVPHDQAVARINQEFEVLEASARDGELSGQDVSTLWHLTSQKLDELEETIILRRTQGLPASLAVVETDFGKDKMDS